MNAEDGRRVHSCIERVSGRSREWATRCGRAVATWLGAVLLRPFRGRTVAVLPSSALRIGSFTQPVALSRCPGERPQSALRYIQYGIARKYLALRRYAEVQCLSALKETLTTSAPCLYNKLYCSLATFRKSEFFFPLGKAQRPIRKNRVVVAGLPHHLVRETDEGQRAQLNVPRVVAARGHKKRPDGHASHAGANHEG